jgi:hypothetical protein
MNKPDVLETHKRMKIETVAGVDEVEPLFGATEPDE